MHAILPPHVRVVRALLWSFSVAEWRTHPWRYATAVLAVALGVALGLAVQLINRSAVQAFSQAARTLDGTPDAQFKGAQAHFDESLLTQLLQDPAVAHASPVLELSTVLRSGDGSARRTRVVLLGLDALSAAAINPLSVPRGVDRLAVFAPGQLFLNASALAAVQGSTTFAVQRATSWETMALGGSVNLPGKPVAVMDIGAMQDQFGLAGQVSRIDVRLAPGVNREAWLSAQTQLPQGVSIVQSDDTQARGEAGSRAYRANLTALALVALFVGAYLVFSVVALSVAKRQPQLALLGVLGLAARQRQQLVLAEALVLGLVGAGLGLLLGTGLAAWALQQLGGDLGGGYFSASDQGLVLDATAAALMVLYAALGVGASLVGAWWPAMAVRRMSEASSLKGLGTATSNPQAWPAWALMVIGALLCTLPAVGGLSLGAYAGIACLLVGGIGVLPPLLARASALWVPHLGAHPLALLTLARAHRVQQSATVSGVVAALSLAVALMVMVSSFRVSVTHWLDVMLPAPLYVRASGGADTAHLSADVLAAIAKTPGLARARVQKWRTVTPNPRLPPVLVQSSSALVADNASAQLPWVAGSPLAPERLQAGEVAVHVSEAMVALHGARLGELLTLNSVTNSRLASEFKGVDATKNVAIETPPPLRVMGIWRDYARQHGTVWVADATLLGDRPVGDVLLWPQAGLSAAELQTRVMTQIRQSTDSALAANLLEFASSDAIRAVSLRLFDRSFAVTTWLQTVAIGIGLFGVAASFSAQVLARRKEFGLLAHLGLTRGQLQRLVAAEGALWTSIGAVAGLGLGLVIAGVLVHVVNPQSFHWTMSLHLPWPRLATLMLAVVCAGTLTCWLSGRAALTRQAVMAVKEDW